MATVTDGEVKYLGFMRVIVIQAIIWKLKMCEWGKQRSGPFKFYIVSVEKLAILVLSPIYNKLQDLAYHLLLYFDNKVDKAMNKLEDIVVVLGKKVVMRLEPMAKKAIQVAQTLIQEAITSGVIAALRWAATECMQLFPDLLNTISKLADGLSVLPNLVPINVFKKPGNAKATSGDAEASQD